MAKAYQEDAAPPAAAMPVRLVFALKPFAHSLFFPGSSLIIVDAESRQQACVVEPCRDHVAGDVIRIRSGPARPGCGGKRRGIRPARSGGGDLLLREEFGWCEPSMPVVFIDEPNNLQLALMASDTRCYGYLALCGRSAFAHASRVYALEPAVDAGARPGVHHDPNSRKGGSLTRREREVEEMKREGSMAKERPMFAVERRGGEMHVYGLSYDVPGGPSYGSTGSGGTEDVTVSGVGAPAPAPARKLVARMFRVPARESPLAESPWFVPADWEHIELAIDDAEVDPMHAVAMLMNAKREAHCCLGCSHIGMIGLGGMGGRGFF